MQVLIFKTTNVCGLLILNRFLGLTAFEHEGIQNITALKDQLVAANHDQTPTIVQRHANVIARYICKMLLKR